jgi:hypothetical protein
LYQIGASLHLAVARESNTITPPPPSTAASTTAAVDRTVAYRSVHGFVSKRPAANISSNDSNANASSSSTTTTNNQSPRLKGKFCFRMS